MIFLYLLPVILGLTSAANDKTINLNLETSFLLDANRDMGLIQDFKKFIGYAEHLLARNSEKAARKMRSKDKESVLMEFFQGIGKVLLKYRDNDIDKAAGVFFRTLETYYDTSTYHAIVNDPLLKQYLQTLHDQLSKLPAEKLRAQIKTALASNETTPLTQFFDAVDKFYDTTDRKKLRQIVKKCKKFAKIKTGLNLLTKLTLDFIIFNRYDNLNYSSKVDLSKTMKLLNEFANTRNQDAAFKQYRRQLEMQGNKMADREIFVNKDFQIDIRKSGISIRTPEITNPNLLRNTTETDDIFSGYMIRRHWPTKNTKAMPILRNTNATEHNITKGYSNNKKDDAISDNVTIKNDVTIKKDDNVKTNATATYNTSKKNSDNRNVDIINNDDTTKVGSTITATIPIISPRNNDKLSNDDEKEKNDDLKTDSSIKNGEFMNQNRVPLVKNYINVNVKTDAPKISTVKNENDEIVNNNVSSGNVTVTINDPLVNGTTEAVRVVS